jgi:uncharacterized protein DUF3592
MPPAAGRSMYAMPTYEVVACLTFGGIVVLGVIWFAVNGLLARRRAFLTTARVVDVHRHSASGELDDVPGPLLTRSNWYPVVELTGPDGRTREVTLSSVRSRPPVGGTVEVLCDPDDPSLATLRSFTAGGGPALCLGLVIGLTFTLTSAMVLWHRFHA